MTFSTLRSCLVFAAVAGSSADEPVAKADPQAPTNFCQQLTVSNALDPIFNGEYVIDDSNDKQASTGFPVYGHVTVGESRVFSKFIYPAMMKDGTMHYVFDNDQSISDGFFGGTPILDCDALPTSRGSGAEFWKADLSTNTKTFHWNPKISITCDAGAPSNPNCGVVPTNEPTSKPTPKPTMKPTNEPTSKPTNKPTPRATFAKLKLGAAITPAPTPKPSASGLGVGAIIAIVAGVLAFLMCLFFAATKRKDNEADDETPVATQ